MPSAFAGVAIGLCASAALRSIPAPLAVAAAEVGFLLAVSRQGWLSLFLAANIIPSIALIPVLTLAIVPAWLLVTGRPQMLIEANKSVAPTT